MLSASVYYLFWPSAIPACRAVLLLPAGRPETEYDL